LRDLEESDHLAREGERWRWSSPGELPLATSFDEIVARRVQRLPVECVPILELAATLGRDFDEAFALQGSRCETEEVRERVRRLAEASFLLPTYDRAAATYRLTHDEVARALRDAMSSEARSQCHRRVADALAATRSGSHAEIAAHYEAAAMGTEAYQHAVLAADDATAFYDSTSVAELLTVASRHAPSPDALATVRVRLASIAEAAGRYEEAESLCDLALAWYESVSDLVKAIELKRMRALVRMQRGQAARATLDALTELIVEADQAGADAERAAILLMSSQVLARPGEPGESERVAEECVAIAERCNDPVLLTDSYNRLAVSLLMANPARARELFVKALETIVPVSDALRRARILNNIGILELTQNRWQEARESLTAAAEFSRTAGLTELWGRAALNLGVLAIRTGDYATASHTLGEALKLCAEAQNTELQLITTYNLANLARDTEQYDRAGATYELAMELAERIGQSDIQLGALAGMALCRMHSGDLAEARRLNELVQSQLVVRAEWFQGRELVEALAIHLAMREGGDEAAQLFTRAISLADTRDVYGGVWLTAEFGAALRVRAPESVNDAVQRYATRPEVIGNPRVSGQFTVLMLDSTKTVDRD
jgi:tetratricopeptide (TPR) repeat protein